MRAALLSQPEQIATHPLSICDALMMHLEGEIGLSPKLNVYPLTEINEALLRIRENDFALPSVIAP